MTTDQGCQNCLPDGWSGGDIKRVLLCGAQSTGKSTLMADVIKHLKLEQGGEVGRSIMQENGWTPTSIDPATHPDVFENLQVQVLRRQKEIDLTFQKAGVDYMSDRSLDPFVYAAVYLGEDAKDRLTRSELGQYCIHRVRKSLVFLITPHREIARNDSVRMPADFDKMQEYTDKMRQTLLQYNVTFEEVTILDRQRRVNQVLETVRSVWPELLVQGKNSSS